MIRFILISLFLFLLIGCSPQLKNPVDPDKPKFELIICKVYLSHNYKKIVGEHDEVGELTRELHKVRKLYDFYPETDKLPLEGEVWMVQENKYHRLTLLHKIEKDK